jgi:hypothetical protein
MVVACTFAATQRCASFSQHDRDQPDTRDVSLFSLHVDRASLVENYTSLPKRTIGIPCYVATVRTGQPATPACTVVSLAALGAATAASKEATSKKRSNKEAISNEATSPPPSPNRPRNRHRRHRGPAVVFDISCVDCRREQVLEHNRGRTDGEAEL